MRMARRVSIVSLILTLLTVRVRSVKGSSNVNSVFDDCPGFLGAAKADEPMTPPMIPRIIKTTMTFLHFIGCLLTLP